MDALAPRFAASLKRGRPDLDVLRVVGEPDPRHAAESFRRAAALPDLAASSDRWGPALLRSARPGFAAQMLEELAQRVRARCGAPLDLSAKPALLPILGSSNFLARLLLRHPDWIDALDGPLPEAPSRGPVEADWTAIRRFKYRGLLRIAARDLLERPFAEGLRELSDLADRCLEAALECSARETGVSAPALFALGKLGGRELNFSSDVDLLFVYDTPADADGPEHNQELARLIQHLKRQLDRPTREGFGYRVDLDLRPEGRSGVLANSVDAALTYYETFGAEWERQMLIRLRPVAGPSAVSRAFATGIAPFVYRRLIDPGAMRAVREMKARIEDERRRAGRDLEADLKEGPGGIRDVEFLVQSFQLFFGARHAELRTGNVLESLAALGRLGLLREAATTALADGYTWLRRAEHAGQMVEEQQTASFPRDPAGQIALARRMGYDDASGQEARVRLLDDWTAVRGVVREHFEALVLSDAA